jgi:hypothetical protein
MGAQCERRHRAMRTAIAERAYENANRFVKIAVLRFRQYFWMVEPGN